MKVQAQKNLSPMGVYALYKNIDLEGLLRDYREKISDLRGCL